MRIALGIEYDGTDFFGWQRLSHGRSVQGVVEAALAAVAAHPVEVTCAGRTDAGVHARCQVVHFDSESVRSERAWTLGTNSNLPRDVAVIWARPVADGFHARFGARARRYRYTILNRPVRAALDARFVTWERVRLDAEVMHRAAQALIGEHDFSAFRTVQCQANSPMRNVREIVVARDGDTLTIDIEANAFLHHMVRNIVGSLLPIGRGERAPEWLAELLRGRDRSVAGPTAPASGLTFLAPRYPAEWGLPASCSYAHSLPPLAGEGGAAAPEEGRTHADSPAASAGGAPASQARAARSHSLPPLAGEGGAAAPEEGRTHSDSPAASAGGAPASQARAARSHSLPPLAGEGGAAAPDGGGTE